MANFDTIRSADAAGLARFEKWRQRWERDFFEPVALDQLRKMLLSLPPQQMAMLAEGQPKEFENVMSKILGGNNG